MPKPVANAPPQPWTRQREKPMTAKTEADVWIEKLQGAMDGVGTMPLYVFPNDAAGVNSYRLK
jgi:hypothetical protein